MPADAPEKTGDRIQALMRVYLGDKMSFSFNDYLKSRGISDLEHLNLEQKKQLAEDLVEKIIKPATSMGKTSLARVELMSILRIGVDIWKITPNYVPSPRDRLLAEEVKNEFRKLKHQALARQIIRYKLREKLQIDEATREEIMGAVISDIFGLMSHTTLAYARELFNQYPVEWVMTRNLGAYMSYNEAAESARTLGQLLDVVSKTKERPPEDPGKIDEKLLSGNLMNYFNDTNELLVRKFKNEYKIDNTKRMTEEKKQRMLNDIMSHYFGFLSQKFLSMEYDKLGLKDDTESEATQKLRLINAILYDCLHSSLVSEDANKAHEAINKIINP